MNILVKLASGFMNLFTLGGEQFVSWVTGIIPTVLMLLLLMNAIIALAGDESVTCKSMYQESDSSLSCTSICICIYVR